MRSFFIILMIFALSACAAQPAAPTITATIPPAPTLTPTPSAVPTPTLSPDQQALIDGINNILGGNASVDSGGNLKGKDGTPLAGMKYDQQAGSIMIETSEGWVAVGEDSLSFDESGNVIGANGYEQKDGKWAIVPTPEISVEFVKVEDVKQIENMMDGNTPEKRAAIAKVILAGMKDGSIPGFGDSVVPFVPTEDKRGGKFLSYFLFDWNSIDKVYKTENRPLMGVTLVSGGVDQNTGEKIVYGVQALSNDGLIWYRLGTDNLGRMDKEIDLLFNGADDGVILPMNYTESDCPEHHNKEMCDAYLAPEVAVEREKQVAFFMNSERYKVPEKITNREITFLAGLVGMDGILVGS